LFQVPAIAENAPGLPIRLVELSAEPLFAKERKSGAEAMVAKADLVLSLRKNRFHCA